MVYVSTSMTGHIEIDLLTSEPAIISLVSSFVHPPAKYKSIQLTSIAGPEKGMWITEFASTNWNQDQPLPRDHVESFARECVKYLDTLDWVERYCWFGPMRNTGTVGVWARMLDDEGKLTNLGKAYRDE